MIKCGCGNDIHPERYELGYKICLTCGDKVAQKHKKFGYISYGHKTAGAIVVTAQALAEQGSGVSMSTVTVNLTAYGK